MNHVPCYANVEMNEVSLKPDSSKQVCLVGVMAYS